MSAAVDDHQADTDELAGFGYKPSLDRSLGAFASFAAGVSYISILTGMFQGSYLGYALGGPAYWWTWLIVGAGQMAVALCFAELAAHYPVAGSIYNWSKRVAGSFTSWMAGWMMLTASIVTVAAVALAYQIILPQISPDFQFIGDGTGKYDAATNAVVLGTGLIIFTTVVNCLGVRVMARINSTGVFIELIAAVLLLVLLLFNATRGPGVVFETNGTGEGRNLGYLGAFLAAALASAYVMYGFDTAGSLGEETKDPRRKSPKAILRALSASFLIGGSILLFGSMAVSDTAAEELGIGGIAFITKDVLGNTAGNMFLWCVIIAITVCCLAVHTATIRVIFAMARDNNLPGSARLAHVSERAKSPAVPAIIVGALAIVLLLVNIRQPQIFSVLISIAIIMVYIAYLFVTIPMLRRRLTGEWPPPDPTGRQRGYFGLGRWGLPINMFGATYGALMAFNLAWPRKEIYNAVEPFHWYLQYGAYLFISTIALVGALYYWFVQRHKTGVLAEHAAPAPAALVTQAPVPGVGKTAPTTSTS